MSKDKQDVRYEKLYSDMMSYGTDMHEKNKKRIKVGTIVLILLPLILGIIRWLTHSDKVVFLMIWVACMFALAAYLISVEYMDESMQKNIGGMMDRDSGSDEGEAGYDSPGFDSSGVNSPGFDSLVPDRTPVSIRVRKRIDERIDERAEARRKRAEESADASAPESTDVSAPESADASAPGGANSAKAPEVPSDAPAPKGGDES